MVRESVVSKLPDTYCIPTARTQLASPKKAGSSTGPGTAQRSRLAAAANKTPGAVCILQEFYANLSADISPDAYYGTTLCIYQPSEASSAFQQYDNDIQSKTTITATLTIEATDFTAKRWSTDVP